MKRLLSLFLLAGPWPIPFAQAQNSCATIFVAAAELGEYGVNASLMAPYYISMFRDSQTVAGLKSRAGLLVKDIFNSTQETHATLVTHFQPRKSQISVDAHFQEQVAANSDFVIRTYSERRDWSPELREHLKAEARLYAEQSTYIEVRKLNPYDFTPTDLIGTMKIVRVDQHTPLRQLPLERDFSVLMPSNGGKKFEPANFVVDKDHNKLGTSEIFTQLILHAREQLKSPTHESDKLLYYTAADRLGVKMYGKLGFKAVPGFESPYKEGTKDWWMIGATAETLARLPESLAENKAQWKTEDIGWMTQLVSNFENLAGAKIEIEGFRSKQVQSTGGKIPEMGLFLSEPFTYKAQNYHRLTILSFGSGEVEINFRLPQESFPLRNGWERKEGALRFLYKDGIFKVYDLLFKSVLEVKTDGNFKRPEFLHYKDLKQDVKVRF